MSCEHINQHCKWKINNFILIKCIFLLSISNGQCDDTLRDDYIPSKTNEQRVIQSDPWWFNQQLIQGALKMMFAELSIFTSIIAILPITNFQCEYQGSMTYHNAWWPS